MLTLPKVQITPKKIDWNGLPKRFMNENELETLIALIDSVEPKVVMEFGINVGRTAKAILREVEGIEQYIGVDVLPGYVTPMRVQRKEIPEQAAEMVVGDRRLKLFISENGSFDIKPKDLPKIDVAFIDGDHSDKGVRHDTALARATVRKGGLIIWHDYHDLGTVQVRDVLHEYQREGHIIKHIDGTWLAFEVVE